MFARRKEAMRKRSRSSNGRVTCADRQSRYAPITTPNPMLPIPVAGMLFNGPAGKFADTRGYRPVMMTGGLLQLVGGVILVVGVTAEPNVVVWLIALSFVGVGTSFIWPAIFGNTVLGVPPARYGEVTAINQTAQRMANATGVALAVSLIGEVAFTGVGTYSRIFLLTAAGGAIAVMLGWYMGERRTAATASSLAAVG